MSAALSFDIEKEKKQDPEDFDLDVTVVLEEHIDLKREVEEVAQTFKKSIEQEELDNWSVRTDIVLFANSDQFGVSIDSDLLFQL